MSDDLIEPSESEGYRDAIHAHLEAHIGPVHRVFHELISEIVHIDIVWIPPTPDRPYHVLATTGVSDQPMTVPAGRERWRRAELLMVLPPDWPMTAWDNDSNYWPIRWLKIVGRLPHQNQTWIGWGHTIPHQHPPQPIADTAFTSVLLLPPYGFPSEFFQLTAPDGEPISFYQVVPLYPEELDLVLSQGTDALEQRFEDQDIDFILDVDRTNVAA
jgi:hypothetical protein